jgi:transposase InsO family protein
LQSAVDAEHALIIAHDVVLDATEKRVYRLYAEEGLAVRRRKRKRLVRDRPLEPRLIRPNQEWAMDFIVDGLATRRMLRILRLVDGYRLSPITHFEARENFIHLTLHCALGDFVLDTDSPFNHLFQYLPLAAVRSELGLRRFSIFATLIA